jgi:hypothetical protein
MKRRWLRGRELNPQGQGYEPRLGPSPPLGCWHDSAVTLNAESLVRLIGGAVPPPAQVFSSCQHNSFLLGCPVSLPLPLCPAFLASMLAGGGGWPLCQPLAVHGCASFTPATPERLEVVSYMNTHNTTIMPATAKHTRLIARQIVLKVLISATIL